MPLLIDGSTVLGLVLSDVILVASRSLLFKENNVACYQYTGEVEEGGRATHCTFS